LGFDFKDKHATNTFFRCADSNLGWSQGVQMGTRFLIVDDNELVRRSLRAVLRTRPGWEVCGEAPDGATAVEMVRNLQPDLVMLDFQMPGMNGIETARRMLEIAPTAPIVLFTQHAGADLEKHALEAGIRSVVSKTNPSSMMGIIEALLSPRGVEQGPESSGPKSCDK
jgi:DNA-binding NarL/FixJ family response regulator